MTGSLYQRLGGFAGITRIVDDVMEAHLANPAVDRKSTRLNSSHT